MPSTYSPLKIQLMATGENNTTWGDVANVNLGTALEEAIVGSADVAFSNANVTLTLTDTNASQTARNMRLNLTGTATSGYNLVVPSIEKPYIINNGTDGTITVKNATGTGIAVPAGKTMWVYNDGTNVVDAVTRLSSLTLGTALVVGSGGTGVNTFTSNGVLLGNGTSAISATAAGTTGQVLVGNTGSAPSWATLSGIGVTSFSAGTTGLTPSTGTTGAVTLAGTLGVANGGTGATSLTSGYLVKGNGTSAVAASVVYDDGTNVGIGTSSPSFKLDVQGNSSSTATVVRSRNNDTTSASFAGYGCSTGEGISAEWYSYSSANWFGTKTSHPQLFITNNSERMRIDASGNVGIGTSSPGNKLDIVSTGSSQIRVKDGVGATSYYDFGRDGTDGFFGFSGAQTTFSGYKWSVNAGTEVMRITNGGNVGIGTSSPGKKLDLIGQFRASNSAASGYALFEYGTSATATNNWHVGSEGDGTFRWYNGNFGAGTERMRITADGNLQLGTASLATTATDGFPYIPTCAGTPTGTPTAITGYAPMVVDSTNNKLYVYVGGAWQAMN